jgi:hypothetical protein
MFESVHLFSFLPHQMDPRAASQESPGSPYSLSCMSRSHFSFPSRCSKICRTHSRPLYLHHPQLPALLPLRLHPSGNLNYPQSPIMSNVQGLLPPPIARNHPSSSSNNNSNNTIRLNQYNSRTNTILTTRSPRHFSTGPQTMYIIRGQNLVKTEKSGKIRCHPEYQPMALILCHNISPSAGPDGGRVPNHTGTCFMTNTIVLVVC